MHALIERLLGDGPGRIGVAGIILNDELDIGRIELRERHFGGIAHRLTGKAGVASR